MRLAQDGFLLLITDIMINDTCSFECMPIIDGLFGYNQIKMYSKYEKHRLLQNLQVVYYYTIIAFSLGLHISGL